jgi:DNA repair photolyase
MLKLKPEVEKTSVEQYLSNRKGVSWIDDCRLPYADESDAKQVKKNFTGGEYNVGTSWSGAKTKKLGNNFNEKGRYPANLLVSDDVLGEIDSKFFSLNAWLQKQRLEGLNIDALEKAVQKNVPFLVVKKPSTKERNFGCEDIISKQKDKKRRKDHPTVKPILLMTYLITMGSREGELVLDPFCGTGTTCMAARLLKRPSIGIEKKPKYYKIAAARMRALTLATWGENSKKEAQQKPIKASSNSAIPVKAAKKVVIYHDKPGIALTPQKKIDSHNFPFTLNTIIGCHFGCQYCYLQGYPFNRHAKFSKEAKVKLWIAERLDKDLTKYKHLPQHLKRVQVNVATEGYLPTVMAKVKKELNRDIMAEVLQVFRKHWENGNHWMVHLITKSHMVIKHLGIISAMKDQIQLEMTITTLDEKRRRQIEGCAPSVQKRLKVMREFATAGVFVRAMCMPLIGTRQEAEAIKDACFDHGARAFKHKGVNYWDEGALLYGEPKRESGRQDEVFEDLLVNSCEPYRVNGEIQKIAVKMPVVVKSGKSKRWKGYKETDFQDCEIMMEVSGYSEINEIEWGYVT